MIERLGVILSRIETCQLANRSSVLLANDVVTIRLFSLREDVCIPLAILDPVGFTRKSSGSPPARLDAPAAVGIVADEHIRQELGILVRDLLCLIDYCLLVENAILFHQTGCRIANDPAVVAGRSACTLFVGNNFAHMTSFLPFNTVQTDSIASDRNGIPKELRNILYLRDPDSILFLACFLANVNLAFRHI